jgi:hypothetical protein
MLDQKQLLHEALTGAVSFEADQQERGIPPLKTAAAAAGLIGMIVGEGAQDQAQIEKSLGHLFKVIRLIADGRLAQKQEIKH